MSADPAAKARAVSRAVVSQVIVRGCRDCGHQRVIGEPCAGCGLTDPPVVHDLGISSASYRNPVKKAWWLLLGRPAADRRARAANRHALTNEGVD